MPLPQPDELEILRPLSKHMKAYLRLTEPDQDDHTVLVERISECLRNASIIQQTPFGSKSVAKCDDSIFVKVMGKPAAKTESSTLRYLEENLPPKTSWSPGLWMQLLPFHVVGAGCHPRADMARSV